MKRNKFYLAFVMAFLSGLIAGGIGGFYVHRKHVKSFLDREKGPKMINHMVLKRLDHVFQLKSEQSDQVEAILVSMNDQFKQIREYVQPKSKKIIDAAVEEIKLVMSEEQLVDFDEKIKNVMSRMHSRKGGGKPTSDGRRSFGGKGERGVRFKKDE